MPTVAYPVNGTTYDTIVRLGLNVVSPTNINLDSNYVWNTSGDAFASPFQCYESGDLTDIWIAVISFNGTWGSTDGVINWEIREGWGVTNQPGSSLVASGTITLAGTEANQWVKVSGLSVSLTAGKVYFLIIGDADGSASNYVTLRRDVRNLASGVGTTGCTTTDGWASVRTSVTFPICAAWKIGGQMYSGTPTMGTVTSVASGTYGRGTVIIPKVNLTIIGFAALTPVVTYSTGSITFKIFEEGQLPTDTPIKEVSLTTQIANGATPYPPVYLFPPSGHYTLRKGKKYYAVVVPSFSASFPRYNPNFGNMDDDLRLAVGGSLATMYWAWDNSGVWGEDVDATSELSLITGIQGFPTVVG